MVGRRRGGGVAGGGAELDAVAVGVVDEQERLSVVTHALAFDLEAVLLQRGAGPLEVLHLEGVVDAVGLGRRLLGLDQVHHDAAFQLQPGDLGVVNLALDLLDAQQVVVELHGYGGVLGHGGHMVDLVGGNQSGHGPSSRSGFGVSICVSRLCHGLSGQATGPRHSWLPSTTRATPPTVMTVPSTSQRLTFSCTDRNSDARISVNSGLADTMGATTTTSACCSAK